MLDRKMHVKNFGLKSRDINKAALTALRERNQSYKTIHDNAGRFAHFSKWLDEQHGIKDMRRIEKHHVVEYAEFLAYRIEDG